MLTAVTGSVLVKLTVMVSPARACVATALLFHANFGDRNQLLHFEKDMAIAGAFLGLFAFGAGGWSVDAWRKDE